MTFKGFQRYFTTGLKIDASSLARGEEDAIRDIQDRMHNLVGLMNFFIENQKDYFFEINHCANEYVRLAGISFEHGIDCEYLHKRAIRGLKVAEKDDFLKQL